MQHSNERILDIAGRSFILLGTAHVSEQSVQEVRTAISQNIPDVVAIELDEKRLQSLEDPEAWRKMDIIKVLKEKNGFLMMANLILASYLKRMGMQTGVKPGDDMLAAVNTAKELHIPQVMVDRPISVTLRRAWAKNSLVGKCNLLAVLISSAFSKEEITSEQIENLKQKSEMDGMMSDLAESLPAVKEVLTDERDKYLASHIWACNGSRVLAVLGAGHLPGVQSYLERFAAGTESPDCSDIDQVPEKTLASRLLLWLVPALIVALIVVGFIFGGAQRGWNMVGAWVLWNGILAAVGALVAGGHPLTIAVSFVGAPFTSLCPFIGIGIVAGIVQACVCKPKVSDMESLQDDVASVKGFYRNRILRTLLVFVLSSIGSSVGTIVAGASFVGVLASVWHKVLTFFVR